MPMYEYYCPACKSTFDRLRPMNAPDAEVRCATGHGGARRLVSAFTVGGRTSVAELEMPATGGGCACGGACACGGH